MNRELMPITVLCLLTLTGCEQEKRAPASPPAPAPTGRSQATSGTLVLSGTARFDGERPEPRRIPTVASVVRQCGESVVDPSLQVSAEGTVSGIVVWIDGLEAPPLAGRKPRIDQRGCLYSPAIVAASVGDELEIVNSDPLLHNVRASQAGKTSARSLFNLAMPVEGMTVRRKLPTTAEVVELHCDVHPWMRAWVRTFDHPYFAVTDAEGRFRIERLPPGKHVLKAWHPRLLGREQSIELSAGAEGKTVLVWGAKDVLTP